MARPQTEGLEYFSVDVEWDDEMEAMIAVHGNDGLAVMVNAWKGAYRRDNGEMALDTLSLRVGFAKRCNVQLEKLDEILGTAFELDLLDRAAYEDRKILTSNGIKKRLERITADRERMRNKRRTNSEQTPNKPGTNTEQTSNLFPIRSLKDRGGGEQTANSVSLSLSLLEDQENGQSPPEPGEPVPSVVQTHRLFRMSDQARAERLRVLKAKLGSAGLAERCIDFYERQISDWACAINRPEKFDGLVRRAIREDYAKRTNWFHPKNQERR